MTRPTVFGVDFAGTPYLVLSLPARAETVRLTRAEREVRDLVLAGASNADIAAARGTSLCTVANQIAAIFRKYRVGSRAALSAVCQMTMAEEPPAT